VKYTKPALSFEQQSQILLDRGLIADKTELCHFLSRVNYYRFSGYLFPFRKRGSDVFIDGTTFEKVKNIYDFDQDLRHYTLSLLEEIEIAILRTKMVERFTREYGPFCYTDENCFSSNISSAIHYRIMDSIDQNLDRSDEEFIIRFRTKYTAEKYLPFWMVSESNSFGLLSLIFKYLPRKVIIPLSKQFNLHSNDFISWIHSLSNVRNICAHYSRLWNRVLPIKPAVPIRKYHPEFYNPQKIRNDKYLVILAIMNYLMVNINNERNPVKEFKELVDRYPQISLDKMGVPLDWQSHPVFNI